MNQHNETPPATPSPEHRTYKKQSFEDRYKRMTIYVRKDYYNEVQYLREQGKITNLTNFINLAISKQLHG